MTVLNITRDVSGAVAYGLPFCDNNQYIVLTTNTEATLTVPSNTNFNVFDAVFAISPGGSVWIADGSVAITLPTTSFAATSAQLNPSVRRVLKGETLRFISGDSATAVGVSFYGFS